MIGFPQIPQPHHAGDSDGGDKKKDSRIEYSSKELESSTTMEKEAELRHKNDKMRIEAKMRVKAEIERENWDIVKLKIGLKAAEERIAKLESNITHSQVTGLGMIMAIAGCLTLASCSYGVKYSFGLFRLLKASFLEGRLGKPSLVRETSQITVGSAVKHPFKTIAQLIKGPEDLMKGIILKPTLEQRLRGIAMSTRYTTDTGGYFRNMLFYGPPGTGKSMFAKRLAKQSGLDFALMLGSDVAPLGKKALAEVHKVFNWARTSRKGVVLYVDQAETFLGKRNTEVISEDMSAALNEFLYRAEELSNKFMVVLASCHPEQFDPAINIRINEKVEFEIPSYEERERLVRHYFQKLVLESSASKSGRLCVAEFDFGKKWTEIAEKTEGLSGQEISELGVAWQAKAYASKDGVLTEKMVNYIVNNAVKQHKQKVDW